MAIKEKFSNLSQKILFKERTEEETKQNENLKPIRARIKKLDKERLDLEMIKNSLDFKKETTQDGLGMKEHAMQIAGKKEKTRQLLEEIVAENPKVMAELGIKNVDELTNIPDFTEDEEVLAYKHELQREDGLHLSDAQLKNRLVKMGVKIDDQNFSYELASQGIGQRLEDLENELLTEKLKTPEGKEEVTNKLSEEFLKNIKDIEFESMSHKNYKNIVDKNNSIEADSSFNFVLKNPEQYSGDSAGIEVFDDRVAMRNFYNLKLLPENFKKQIDRYGEETSQEALIRSYNKKTDLMFASPNLLGKQKDMRVALESVSPEKRKQVLMALEDFELKKKELLNILQSKSEELKEQKIDFSGEYASGYGLEYNKIFRFSSRNDAKDVIDNLQSGDNNFFPKYDFDKIKDIAECRVSELDQVIGIVNNIKDEKGVDNFLYNKNSDTYVGCFHEQSLSNNLSEDFAFKLPTGVKRSDAEELSRQFYSYSEAVEYIDQKIAELEEIKKNVSEKLAEAVEYQVTEFNLCRQHGHNFNLRGIEYMIKGNKVEKEYAQKALLVIAELQVKLPVNEDLQVSGSVVEVPEKIKEYKELNQDKTIKEDVLKEKRLILNSQENSEPLFGKNKWRNKISLLKKEIEEDEKEITDLKNKYNQAIEESYYYADIRKLSSFSKSRKLFEEYSASGKSTDIFIGLSNKFKELTNREVPAYIQKFYIKLKDLSDRLNGKV